jgi:hypothetical protein
MALLGSMWNTVYTHISEKSSTAVYSIGTTVQYEYALCTIYIPVLLIRIQSYPDLYGRIWIFALTK